MNMQISNLDNILKSCGLNILYFVAAVSPFVSLYAGLSLAGTFVLVALIPTIFAVKNNIWWEVLHSHIYKVVLVFLAYSLISIIWAIDPKESFDLWYRMVLMFVGFVALFEFIKDLNGEQKELLAKILMIGFVVALVAANIEIVFDGVVTKFFRGFQEKEHVYGLVDLNRGASYLSILFWPVFAYLMCRRRWLYALLLLGFTGCTLFRLESQSSSVALVLSLIAFIFVCFLGRRFVVAMMLVAVFSVVSVAVVSKAMDPAKMFKVVPNIPHSASEYRLYIWDFAAEKAAKKPIWGWGFNASRSIPVSKEDYVLNGRHPLPLHPHNNVIQIWLELGFVGLLIFTVFLLVIMWRIQKISPMEESHCLTHVELVGRRNHLKYMGNVLAENMPAALVFGLFATYFAIGVVGYGIWQNWWVAAGLLSVCFMRNSN